MVDDLNMVMDWLFWLSLRGTKHNDDTTAVAAMVYITYHLAFGGPFPPSTTYVVVIDEYCEFTLFRCDFIFAYFAVILFSLISLMTQNREN